MDDFIKARVSFGWIVWVRKLDSFVLKAGETRRLRHHLVCLMGTNFIDLDEGSFVFILDESVLQSSYHMTSVLCWRGIVLVSKAALLDLSISLSAA